MPANLSQIYIPLVKHSQNNLRTNSNSPSITHLPNRRRKEYEEHRIKPFKYYLRSSMHCSPRPLYHSFNLLPIALIHLISDISHFPFPHTQQINNSIHVFPQFLYFLQSKIQWYSVKALASAGTIRESGDGSGRSEVG